MKRTYSCPECRATLNPSVTLILTMARGRHRSLILLSPQPGNYRTTAQIRSYGENAAAYGDANVFDAGGEQE